MPEFAVSNVREWECVASEAFVPLCCTDYGAGFSAALTRTELHHGISLAKVRSDAVRVERTASLARQSEQNDLLLSLQLRARGRVHQHNRTAVLNPGSAALYETNQPYVLDHSQDHQELLVLRIPRENLELTEDVVKELCGRTIDRSVPGMSAFTGYLVGVLQEQGVPTSSIAPDLGHLSLEMLKTVLRSLANIQPTLENADRRLTTVLTTFIKNNFQNSELSVTHIAEAHHISPRKLYELFAKIDETPGRYLQRVRLDHAKRLLSSRSINNKSIESIALSCGFSSAATFARTFKHSYGAPPSEWAP